MKFPLLCALALACPAFAQPAKPALQTTIAASPTYSNWKLVAQSDLIVRGRLIAPVQTLRARSKSKKPNEEILKVRIHQVLKGKQGQKSLAIRISTPLASYEPSLQTILSLNGKEVVAMVGREDGESIQGQFLPSPSAEQSFFAGYSPEALQPDSSDLALRIRTEVQNQERIAAEFSRLPAARPDASEPKVKALIQAMLNEKSEQKAFADLESLGAQAVPSTIRLMDDRRRLPFPGGIMLRNKSLNAFEGARQYRPDVVVDALAAILNQVTGESFGFIYNGASQRERQREVNGWRVFLHYRFSKNPSHPFTAPILK